MQPQIIEVLNAYVDKLKPRNSVVGTIVSMMPSQRAKVMLPDGTMVIIHVPYQVANGDRIICQRPEGSGHWLAVGVDANNNMRGAAYGVSARENEEVAKVRKPYNLESYSVDGGIVFQWASYPDFAGGFEIEASVDGPRSEATSIHPVKGNQVCVLNARYAWLRVRGVNDNMVRTSWSDWCFGENTSKTQVSFRAGGALGEAVDVQGGYVCPFDAIIQLIYIRVGDTGTSGNTEIDVNVNEVSLFISPVVIPNDSVSGIVAIAPGSGAVHAYDIISVDIDSVADEASDLSVTILLRPLSSSVYLRAPSNLAATVDVDTVSLTWIDNSVGESGFSLERSNEGVNTGFSEIATPSAGDEDHDDESVPAGAYWYRIRAVGAGGYSAYSNTVEVIVAA